MPRKHPEEVRLQALTLAEVGGVEWAAKTLKLDQRTVASWQLQAGEIVPPNPDELDGPYRLALMKLTEEIATGRIKGPQLAVVTGILRDKRERAARWRERLARRQQADPEPPSSDTPLTDAARARFFDWMHGLEVGEGRGLYRYLRFHLDAIEDEEREQEQGITVEEEARTDEAQAASWDDWLAECQERLPEMVAWGVADEQREIARNEQCRKAGRWMTDEEADLLIEADRLLAETEDAA